MKIGPSGSVSCLKAIRGDDAADLALKLNQLGEGFSILALGTDTDRRPYALIATEIVEVVQTKIKKLKGV